MNPPTQRTSAQIANAFAQWYLNRIGYPPEAGSRFTALLDELRSQQSVPPEAQALVERLDGDLAHYQGVCPQYGYVSPKILAHVKEARDFIVRQAARIQELEGKPREFCDKHPAHPMPCVYCASKRLGKDAPGALIVRAEKAKQKLKDLAGGTIVDARAKGARTHDL